ncbi:MAG: Uma2 family endonuclease [Pirellulales bacterium]
MAAVDRQPEILDDDFGEAPRILDLGPSIELTDALFYDIATRNEEFVMELNERGQLEMMSPTGAKTGRRNTYLTVQLGNWTEEDGTGVSFDSSTGFKIARRLTRSPDAAWLLKTRWDALTPAEQEAFAPLCPDFVVELRSPNDRLDVLRKKLEQYLKHGARLGWLIDPLNRQVLIYRPGAKEPDVLRDPSEVSGEDVLPGFTLPMEKIFA